MCDGADRPRQYGHHPVIPPRRGSRPAPPVAEVLEVLYAAAVPALSDAVGRFFTLSPQIRPLHPDMGRIAGRAVTVRAQPGDNWAIHGGLAAAGDGDVVVIDWMGFHEACGSGEKAVIPALHRGVRGIVIDGSWRDVADVAALGFAIAGRGVSPFSPTKRQLGEINVPVHCGGVVVEPGDIVVADGEGAVCVPSTYAATVAEALIKDAEAPGLPPELEKRLAAIGQEHADACAAAMESARTR